MTDDLVTQALADLQDLVRCRCHPAYTGRGLRDPDCECDSTEAVKAVADHIEAQAAEIERLRGDLKKAEAMLDKTRLVLAEWEPHPFPVLAQVRTTLAELKGAKP